MDWITRSPQRSICLLLLITLVLSFSLVACGQHVNASGNGATSASSNNAASQQQYQPVQPAHSQSGNTPTTTNASNLQNADQQVQSIMNQLDSARNDVNNSDAASSQDNGQQP